MANSLGTHTLTSVVAGLFVLVRFFMASDGILLHNIQYARIILHFVYFFFNLSPVTKQRSQGQVLIQAAVDEKLLEQIDANRGALTRSAYIRLALTEMLGIAEEMARPPARQGKGGKPTHKKKPKAVASSKVYHIPFLHLAAGAPIVADAEMIEADKDYGKGRFMIQLHGDSMEPQFKDGQRIVLRDKTKLSRPLLKYGQMYAFIHNGSGTFKVWAKDKAGNKVLRSLNPDYADIPVEEDTDWIGWFDPSDNEV